MTTPTPTTKPATDKQIAYLTTLVKKTGLTFDVTDTLTSKEASAMIDQALDVMNAAKALPAAGVISNGVTTPVAYPADDRKVSDLSITELLELALEKARHIGV